MSDDFRQQVLELALTKRQLLDRVTDLTCERDSYRLLAKQALHALHDAQESSRKLKVSHQRIVAENRDLRQRVRDLEAEPQQYRGGRAA